MAVAFTQADAHAVRRLIAGLDPRNTVARPSPQDTYDCLVQLAEKANRAIHGVAVALRDDQKANLRQLVDDLYRTEPQPGFEPTTCVLLRCNGCNELLDEDYVVHFANEKEARELAITTYDWRERDGKLYCTAVDCAIKAVAE